MKNTFYIALVMAMAFVVSVPVYAANDVTFEAPSQFEVNGMTFRVEGDMDSVSIDSTTFDVTISDGTILTIFSDDSYTFTYDETTGVTYYCNSTNSNLTLLG
ncbi:MAG: hypothetical protein CO073_01670, partial [Candidatus Komeilibacteria bacterium CG_4_9_14_0_8_um_filter_36_9]